MIKVIDAEFVTTGTRAEELPRELIGEVAFVGRSNVGKSSMINTLANRRKLVRVSNTPGRTKTLNFFDVTVEHKKVRTKVRFCDLPGYGYAKVSKVERAQWRKMIGDYLRERATLKIVVCIIDSEVGPTPDDMQMIDMLQEIEPAILVVATKLDRLAKNRRRNRTEALRAQLELPEGALVGFSPVDKIGFDEVWMALLRTLGNPATAE
jgi:GTP-binding protein